MGASKEAYSLFGPQGSFIHVEDFSGPADLGKYLKKLAEDPEEYSTYFAWQGTGGNMSLVVFELLYISIFEKIYHVS